MLPPYRLRTERRLRLTGMWTTVCLKSSKHGVNGIPEWMSVVYCSIMTMSACTQRVNSELSSRQWCSAGHPPTIFTWPSPLWLVFVPFCQKASEGKTVSERRRCLSILRGHHFGHIPVNVVGCDRQLVWGLSNVYRLKGVSSKSWSTHGGCMCYWKSRLQNIMSGLRIWYEKVRFSLSSSSCSSSYVYLS